MATVAYAAKRLKLRTQRDRTARADTSPCVLSDRSFSKGRYGFALVHALCPMSGKYPPAEPGALRIGPLEAATLNPKLCLLGRRTKYTLPTSPRPFIVTPENRCLLRIGSSLDGVEVSRLSIVKLHFVCMVAHDLRFRRWATAVNVKLILPPRQSRGVSRLC